MCWKKNGVTRGRVLTRGDSAGETQNTDNPDVIWEGEFFDAASLKRYEEIADKCQDFLAQVRKEYAANHFTFAELEENEVDLVKLRNWLARVRERDVFGASGLQAA